MAVIADLLALLDCAAFRGKAGPEDRLAMEVANWLRAMSLEGKLLATWTCIPHEVGAVSRSSAAYGGQRAKYAKQKAMGLITGSADYVFVWPDGGGWIEAKVKGSYPSPTQRLFAKWCAATNTNYAICRTVDEFSQTLKGWGALV